MQCCKNSIYSIISKNRQFPKFENKGELWFLIENKPIKDLLGYISRTKQDTIR